MKHSPLLTGAAISSALLLASCNLTSQTPGTGDMSSSSSSVASSEEGTHMTAEGRLEKAGISIYMEGTHRLVTDDGQELLLQSTAVNLDQYLDQRVRVTGMAHPTVEAGGSILTVDSVELVESSSLAPEVLTDSSASSESSSASVMEASSPSSMQASSANVSSEKFSSSAKPLPVSSSSVSAPAAMSSSSAMSQSATVSASVTAMAKDKMDPALFNQKYCSDHIGFCVPVQKNWFYQSFGANVPPYLWHVEISNQAIVNPGDGPIVVNLVPGALDPSVTEGVAQAQGDFVVAQRQWTGNRHFEISGPLQLKTAVGIIASGLEVTQTTGQ